MYAWKFAALSNFFNKFKDCSYNTINFKMQERHFNRKQYFDEQGATTKKFVMPFIENVFKISPTHRILEVGCGEGGNLTPFVDMGCEVVGIDLSSNQIENAKEYLNALEKNNLTLIAEDINNIKIEDIGGPFNLIILRDVIEHIPNQEQFMGFIKVFLMPDGLIFFGFPPWYMPFGGHQQICENKLPSKIPWIHILPNLLYVGILKMMGEKQHKVDELLDIKSTGISIERFERSIMKHGYRIIKKNLYFINPNYETKFGLKTKKLTAVISAIPFVRNFFTTAAYYLIAK